MGSINSSRADQTARTAAAGAQVDASQALTDAATAQTAAGEAAKPGALAYFAASSAPAGWIKANGAAVSRSTYAALFLVIGTTYGVGDGSTTFNVPDLRGEFLRGLDDGRGVDTGRAIGSAQSHQFENHIHGYEQAISGSTAAGARTLGNNGALNGYGSTTTANSGAYGSETRPRNVALLACIKY